MKKLLFLVGLIGLVNYGQTSFKVVDNDLVWQRTFNDSTAHLADYFKKIGFTNNLKYNDNVYSGTSDKYMLPFKKMSSHTGEYFTAFILVKVKPDRYLVTISNIIFQGPEVEIWGVTDKIDYQLKTLILKKDGQIRQNKSNLNLLKELDSYFMTIFTIKKDTDSW